MCENGQSCDSAVPARTFPEHGVFQFQLHARDACSITIDHRVLPLEDCTYPAMTVGAHQSYGKIEGEPWTFTARRSADKNSCCRDSMPSFARNGITQSRLMETGARRFRKTCHDFVSYATRIVNVVRSRETLSLDRETQLKNRRVR